MYEVNKYRWKLKAKCFNDEDLQEQLRHVREGLGFDPFFDKPAQVEWAKKYCRDCPVRLACLAEALKSMDGPELSRYQGIWGGLSDHARAQLKNKQRRQTQQMIAQMQALFPVADDAHSVSQEVGKDEILPPAS